MQSSINRNCQSMHIRASYMHIVPAKAMFVSMTHVAAMQCKVPASS